MSRHDCRDGRVLHQDLSQRHTYLITCTAKTCQFGRHIQPQDQHGDMKARKLPSLITHRVKSWDPIIVKSEIDPQDYE